MQIPVNINQCYTTTTSSCDGDAILLVQGDTNPTLTISVYNQHCNPYIQNTYSEVIDVSSAEVTLKLKLKSSNTIFATVTGTPVAGLVLDDGSINFEYPYDQPGRGGRIAFYWSEGDLSEVGLCEGEVSISYSANSVQTVYNTIPIKIRSPF